MTVRGWIVGAAALSGVMVLGGCAYNEALGRNQFLLIDESSMTQQSDAAWAEALRTQNVSSNASHLNRVRTVGGRVVAAAGLSNRPWDYAVFVDESPNAFVLPTGKIGVTTGLLNLVRNDDQLAAVLGHEIGHVVARHAAERNSTSAIAGLGVQAVQGAAGRYGQEAATASGLFAQYGVLLRYSRRDELEADRLGVDYMVAANYRPSEAVALWRLMAEQRQSATPEFASTHPSDGTRIAALQDYLAQRGWN